MDTPGEPLEGREELAKKLDQMKKKYAHIQRKLQKSAKQKKVKEHVKRTLAELQLTEDGASPANTSREEFKEIRDDERPTGSFPIGPLNLDESIQENTSNLDEGSKLNRKCVSSGRLKKRRSVSFVLDNDDVVQRKKADEYKEETKNFQKTCVKKDSNEDKVRLPMKTSLESVQKEEAFPSSRDGHKPNIYRVESCPKNVDESSCDVHELADSEDVTKDLPDDVTCVEETQDLSQILAPKRLFKTPKRVNPSIKGQALLRKSKEISEDKSSVCFEEATKPASTKTILREYNDSYPTIPNLPNFQDTSTPHQAEITPNLQTFSDPGPTTTRSGRRRGRRSREITAADISMKDVIQNSQSSQEGNHTWIEGLVYPVEYYVRKTRSMSGKASPVIYSENLLASIERMDPMDHVGRGNRGRASARGRKRQQKEASSQHGDGPSQSASRISSEDAGIKSSINSSASDVKAADLVNTYPVGNVEKAESAEIGDGKEQSHCNSQVLTPDSVEIIASVSCELSVAETQLEQESISSSVSSHSSSSNSASSGRRNLSLSRRKRDLVKKSAHQNVAKLNESDTNTTATVPSQKESELDQPSSAASDKLEENIKDFPSQPCDDGTLEGPILPKLTSEVKTQILSQAADFALPDKDFIEMKLLKTGPITNSRPKCSAQADTSVIKSVDPCQSKISNDKVEDIISSPDTSIKLMEDTHKSPEFGDNKHANSQTSAGFATPALHVTRFQSSTQSKELKENSNILIKSDCNSSTDQRLLKTFSQQSQGVVESQSSLKNSSDTMEEDSKLSRGKRPIKPLCQQSQAVLESQFSQSQFIPDGTPAFPHMGCSPGSSPSDGRTQPTLVPSPTSHSERCSMSTMSFSPQQSSPPSGHKFQSGKSQDSSSHDDKNVHPVVNTTRHADMKDKKTELKTSHASGEECVEERPSPPPFEEEILSPPDGEYSPPNNGVITPPMTSGNIAHTSPFANVATATPYGKAEIPRYQSQCDPEDKDDDEAAREEQMIGGEADGIPGYHFAGCLKHDFPDFSAPILGMRNCSVSFNSEQVTCLVVYSVELVVLWIARNQQDDWQIQAAWTVAEDEEVACIKLASCEENVISLVIGGSFSKCCARFLRYNLSTGDQHQLDMSLSQYSEGIVFQDMCIISHDTLLVVGREDSDCNHVVCKFSISEDFSRATSKLIHKFEAGSISMQRVHEVEDLLVTVVGQDLFLCDCQSESVLKKFSIPVGSDVVTTCVWATAQSGVLFTVLGLKPTNEANPGKLIAPCVLLALNPATGKSAILHQYEIPGTTEDSHVWFSDGAVVWDNLAVKTSDGDLVIWDLHSAHPVTKTLNSDLFHWTITKQNSLIITQEGSQCIHQYQATSA